VDIQQCQVNINTNEVRKPQNNTWKMCIENSYTPFYSCPIAIQMHENWYKYIRTQCSVYCKRY